MTTLASKNYKTQSVILDLDGTLVDSASAILEGLEYAIKKAGIKPAIPLSNGLVGPPLKDTLLKLVGEYNDVIINNLISDFKFFYDQEGFKRSMPYPGTEKLLTELCEFGLDLYLATNKRLVPTQKIINYFGWNRFFDEIYTIDKYKNSPFDNKELMLKSLLKEKSIDPLCAVYVGDREEDLSASISNNLSAILVDWGYGDLNKIKTGKIKIASNAEDLLSMIMKKK